MPADESDDQAASPPDASRPGFTPTGSSARISADRGTTRGPKQPPRRPPSASGAWSSSPVDPAGSTSSSATSSTTASTAVIESRPLPVATEPIHADGPVDGAEPQRRVVTKPPKAKRRGRRVKRVIRRIDLWSVLKLSLVVYTCIYLAVLGTLVVVWGLLYSSGTIEKLQSFLEDVGLDNFTFYGNQMFRACAAIGAVGVMAGTVITVLATALVNVISELTGGIRVVVIEEDVEPVD